MISDPDHVALDVALPDPAFEVAWLSSGEVREGSPDRGFRAVQIVGYQLNLIERAAAALASAQSKI